MSNGLSLELRNTPVASVIHSDPLVPEKGQWLCYPEKE